MWTAEEFFFITLQLRLSWHVTSCGCVMLFLPDNLLVNYSHLQIRKHVFHNEHMEATTGLICKALMAYTWFLWMLQVSAWIFKILPCVCLISLQLQIILIWSGTQYIFLAVGEIWHYYTKGLCFIWKVKTSWRCISFTIPFHSTCILNCKLTALLACSQDCYIAGFYHRLYSSHE